MATWRAASQTAGVSSHIAQCAPSAAMSRSASARLYLGAALQTLPGEQPSAGSGESDRGFRYTKQVLAGDTAVLEFETTVDGKYVNGVDIIRCNDEGRIVEFRVMIRPLQAVNLVHQQMKAMLESMKPTA